VSKEYKSTLYRNPYKEQQRPYTTPARPSDAPDAQPKQGRGTASSGGGGPRRPGARLVEDDRREEQEEEDDDHQNQEEEQGEA